MKTILVGTARSQYVVFHGGKGSVAALLGRLGSALGLAAGGHQFCISVAAVLVLGKLCGNGDGREACVLLFFLSFVEQSADNVLNVSVNEQDLEELSLLLISEIYLYK